MKKGTLALGITLTAFGSIPAYSADENRWDAKDPYLGRTYEKEHVSRFAKLSNGAVTISSGIAMVGYTGKYVYDNYKTASYVLPFLSYTLNNVPTLNTFGQIAIASTSLILLGIPSNMLLTYGAKKGATIFENVVTFGWDVFKYGFDAVKYQFDHVRATHLQGTLWQNNKVDYIDNNKKEGIEVANEGKEGVDELNKNKSSSSTSSD